MHLTSGVETLTVLFKGLANKISSWLLPLNREREARGRGQEAGSSKSLPPLWAIAFGKGTLKLRVEHPAQTRLSPRGLQSVCCPLRSSPLRHREASKSIFGCCTHQPCVCMLLNCVQSTLRMYFSQHENSNNALLAYTFARGSKVRVKQNLYCRQISHWAQWRWWGSFFRPSLTDTKIRPLHSQSI